MKLNHMKNPDVDLERSLQSPFVTQVQFYPNNFDRSFHRFYVLYRLLKCIVLHSCTYGTQSHLAPRRSIDPLRLWPTSSEFSDGASFAPR